MKPVIYSWPEWVIRSWSDILLVLHWVKVNSFSFPSITCVCMRNFVSPVNGAARPEKSTRREIMWRACYATRWEPRVSVISTWITTWVNIPVVGGRPGRDTTGDQMSRKNLGREKWWRSYKIKSGPVKCTCGWSTRSDAENWPGYIRLRQPDWAQLSRNSSLRNNKIIVKSN